MQLATEYGREELSYLHADLVIGGLDGVDVRVGDPGEIAFITVVDNAVGAVFPDAVTALARYHRADNLIEAIDRDLSHQNVLIDHHAHHVRPGPRLTLAPDSLVKLLNEADELLGSLLLAVALIELLGHVLGINEAAARYATGGLTAIFLSALVLGPLLEYAI